MKRSGKWFLIDRDMNLRSLQYKVVNESKLLFGRRILSPDIGSRGFPPYPEKPRVQFDLRLSPKARDMEWCDAYWLISDRLKNVFANLDSEAFVFMECETAYPGGDVAPKYWLCDVIRMLDAVDEERSNVDIRVQGETKVYQLYGHTRFVFKEDVVCGSHIFRLKYRPGSVCCDAALRSACIGAKILGVSFREI